MEASAETAGRRQLDLERSNQTAPLGCPEQNESRRVSHSGKHLVSSGCQQRGPGLPHLSLSSETRQKVKIQKCLVDGLQ